ncbi:MAG: SMI1/KNR4 family protein [Desulfamplus sp.]|nr:SMI1/KNR4 family protein [Desulfamplus sp.]
MISKVRDICNEKKQYFVCEGAGGKSDKRFTAGILHKLNQPCNSKELEYIKSILGNFSHQFMEFYKNYNGALLFCDSLSDTAGFELAPVADWERLGEEMRAWYDLLDDEEREIDEFDWLNDGITFGQVPHSGNYFVLALSGSNKGKIIYSDHDGLEPTVYADSLFEFLEKIISNPVNEIEHLGCYARYSDGKTNIQWIPIQYLVNR